MKTSTRKPSLPAKPVGGIVARLHKANDAFNAVYPGESGERQPVHTVYGGAHLFKADSAVKLGELALRSLREYAPNFIIFAKALGLRGADTLPDTLEHIA